MESPSSSGPVSYRGGWGDSFRESCKLVSSCDFLHVLTFCLLVVIYFFFNTLKVELSGTEEQI